MAINNISVLTVSEQEVFSSKQTSDASSSSENASAGFFNQLEDANKAVYNNSNKTKTQNTDEENTIATQPKQAEVSDDAISGDSMLAQINAAHTMDTTVKKNASVKAEVLDEDAKQLKAKPDDQLAPIVIAPHSLAVNETVAKTTVDVDNDVLDSSAVNSQAKDEKLIPLSKNIVAVNKAGVTVHTQSVDAAVISLLSKDSEAIKSDPLLAKLTPEQHEQLTTQLQASSKPNSKDNLATLKQMLTEYVVESDKANAADTVKQALNSQISALTTPEKQALLSQLNSYIKNEQPQGEQLASIKQTIVDLSTSIDSKVHLIANDKANLGLSNTANINTPKSENNNQLEKVVISGISDKEAVKQDISLKEPMRSNSAEPLPPRVTQLFTQITNTINELPTRGLNHNESLGYEQAIIDTQALQTGQLQSTTQAKQVSFDPGVMQALNIIKSDAAKMLQERVSSMLSINNKVAEIRLDPPEMGSMQIRIRSDAEQAQINFVVQNQQAKEALEQTLPRLREMLAQQGIDLGESTISYGESGGQGAEQNEENANSRLANNEVSIDENDEQVNTQISSSRQQTSSSIDYYA